MNIKTLFFGITKDITNCNSIEFEIDEHIDIDQFINLLKNKYPDLSSINGFAIAINEAYAEKDHILKENDVVAIIPPVSGG